jgi:hypothetical protein
MRSLLLALLSACSLTQAPPSGKGPTVSAPVDADADGSPASEDCDDDDPSRNPSAAETCNAQDDDCDGDVDEEPANAPTWYADADSDNHGDPAAPTEACVAPAGAVALGDDCDDGDNLRHPGALETCNLKDDDCDEAIDEDAIDATPWYPDADGDTYGDPTQPTAACTAPEGHVAESSDCDDTRAAVSPAAAELCNRQDDNCDGSIDEGWDHDLDGVTACDGDCDDDNAAVAPGATEVCDTLDNDCDGVADSTAVCPCDVEYWPDTLHPYLYCTAASDWSTADSACATYGYRLVTFDSAAEGLWVEATVNAYPANYWWVGFTDAASEGSWGWTDGSPVTYVNWNSGEPNNGHGYECAATSEEDCAMIRWSGSSWNDYPCACAWPSAVCEGDSEYRPQEL